MNITSLRQTGSVAAICKNVRRYVLAMPEKPARVVLARDVFLKLKEIAKTDQLDFDGIPLVGR